MKARLADLDGAALPGSPAEFGIAGMADRLNPLAVLQDPIALAKAKRNSNWRQRRCGELAAYLRGWAGYFGFSQWHELPSLDGWIRRRLRCVVWVQWKTRSKRYHELRHLGVPGPAASEAVFSPKGPWRLSFTNAATNPGHTVSASSLGPETRVKSAKTAVVFPFL